MPPWEHQIHYFYCHKSTIFYCSIVIPVCLSSGVHRETLHLAVFSLPPVRSLTKLKIYQIRLLFHYKVNIQTAVWATVLVYFLVPKFLSTLGQAEPNDLQTKADRLVQMSICASLARKFPKVTIIGEEVSTCFISY